MAKREITATIRGLVIPAINPVTKRAVRILAGRIYGDTRNRWPDGTFIYSSLIKRGPDKNGVYVTRNSVYKLEEVGLETQPI